MDTPQLQHDKRFFWWLNVNIFIFIFANEIFHEPEVRNTNFIVLLTRCNFKVEVNILV